MVGKLDVNEQAGGGLEGTGAECEDEGFPKEDPGSSWKSIEWKRKGSEQLT